VAERPPLLCFQKSGLSARGTSAFFPGYGGIAPRILDFLTNSEFRRRFEEKGRLRAYLQTIPSQVIVHPAATFLGLTSLALKSASHS
jgi:hypothetical protein